jgi:SAM-dependent methyltransferase
MVLKLKALQSNWDEFGRVDPFWAVLSDPRRKGRGWDPDEFYETGRVEIDGVLRGLSELGLRLDRRRALDFGCGAGRLTQALCKHFQAVVGLDIAPSMISLAEEKNLFGDRCKYLVNDSDDLRLFDDGAFSFIYSRIVLQHVQPEHSRSYIREFLRVLGPGGALVFQVPAGKKCIERGDEALPQEAYRARITLHPLPARMPPGASVPIQVTVENAGSQMWPSLISSGERCNIAVGNHWRRADGQLLVNDDGRLPLPRPIGAGESFAGTLSVRTPDEPGCYQLELDLVQEGVTWFEAKGSPVFRAPVAVQRSALAALGRRLGEALRRRSGPDASAEPSRVEYPQLEIFPVPKQAVLEIIAEGGARLVAAKQDQSAGQGWESYCYVAVKDD